MERRKLITYSIATISVIYGVYFHFLSGDNKKPDPSKNRSAVTEATSSQEASAKPNLQIATFSATKNGSTPVKTRHRNPFRNKRKNTNPGDNPNLVDTPDQIQRPFLTAISIAHGDTLAVVDGKVITTGDRIGSWRFRGVSDDRALFEGSNGMIWVKLGG